ncbi:MULTISPECIES: hypothetical protein [unclassified Photobacterium]|uniref:hypothetical protein n=1 Tax=unclassified Photobacterium TaxID=2628852 RepID=UPI001EDF4A1F|nr:MULTISPECIES: hypothetical protein [unclassified Photobacterium]
MDDELSVIEQKCLSAFYDAWPQLEKFGFQNYKEIISNKVHVQFEIERIQTKYPASDKHQFSINNLLMQRDLLFSEWLRAKKSLEYIESEKAYLRAVKDIAHN